MRILRANLGMQEGVRALRAEVLRRGHTITRWADELIEKMDEAKWRYGEYTFVQVSAAALGFPVEQHWVYSKELFDEALRQKYRLCPEFTGLLLLAQCDPNEFGPWVRIGMEPVADKSKEGSKCVLGIGNGLHGSWLGAGFCARIASKKEDTSYRVMDEWILQLD